MRTRKRGINGSQVLTQTQAGANRELNFIQKGFGLYMASSFDTVVSCRQRQKDCRSFFGDWRLRRRQTRLRKPSGCLSVFSMPSKTNSPAFLSDRKAGGPMGACIHRKEDSCVKFPERPSLRKYRNKGHYNYIGLNGSIRIETLEGEVLLDKPGQDGRKTRDSAA